MKNRIPKNPVLLAAYLASLITGDDKHQGDLPLPKETRTALDEAKTKMDSLNAEVQLSKGRYRKASQERREYISTLQPERFRDAVFGKVGHKDQVLVDYGLVVRRKAHRDPMGGDSPSTVSKAERMKVHLARMQAQLEREKAHQSELEMRITLQEAKVAKAAEVTPHEPTQSPEPNPTSEPASPSEPTK